MQSPCFEEATKFCPTKVFLQVGDNDINMTTSVAEVVSGIREIVNKVSSIKSVKKIVIGNLFRKIICGNMLPSKYNSMVCDINTNLQRFYSDPDKIRFWRLRGLMKPQKNIWLDDGIRLNIDAMKIYALQIQLAIK